MDPSSGVNESKAQWNGAQTTFPYASVSNYGNIPFGQANRRA